MSASPREQDALDYATAEARRRAQFHRDDAGFGVPRLPASNVREPLYGQSADKVRDQLREPSDLSVAISVAQRMLASYGSIGYSDIGTLAQAHGALAETLRIMLRALDAEPQVSDTDLRNTGPSALGRSEAPHRCLGAEQDNRNVLRSQEVFPGSRKNPSAQHSCRHRQESRCPAAHHDDPTPCSGPVVVTVLDAHNADADGCEHHGARLLASLEGCRVYALPDAPEGAAIRVFKVADTMRPFPWMTDAPRTEPSQLSHEENLAAHRAVRAACPEVGEQ